MKKYLIVFLLCISFALTACTKKEDISNIENNKTEVQQIKNRTYKNKKEKIIIKNDTIEFENVDFSDSLESLSQVCLSKELGIELNSLSQQEIKDKLDIIYSDLLNKNILKNNKKYKFIFEGNTISFDSDNINIILELKTEKNKDFITFYHKKFE